MEYVAGANDSDSKLAVDDVITSKSHLEVCRGVTLASDSLSSTSSSSHTSRHHPGQTSVPQDQSESVQTSTVPDDKVLDMSLESEVPVEVGCSVQSKQRGWKNFEEDRHDDEASADNVSLRDYRNVVDLSTSKTCSTAADHNHLERRRHVSSGSSDLDEFPDTAQQRSSLLQSKVVFSQPRSPVDN